jgi:dTDP-4-amino-4,6-dideoxygalactose transaminase
MDEYKVPFVGLSKQFQTHEKQFIDAFKNVGASGNYILGENVLRFEKRIAEYCNSSYAIGVANGSDALFLILKALGVGAGDEVITAANSFVATAWVIIATGAKPVFVDVQDDLNISCAAIKAAITNKTKVIMPVHITGRPASMHKILSIAKENNIFVVEDAAQAVGAKFNGKPVGSFGIAAGFSMHPLKNLGLYGDGGFITTSNQALNEKLRLLRNHGLVDRDHCKIWGYNSRLDEMQAAFANIKLDYLDLWNERCKNIAAKYRKAISNIVKVPVDQPDEDSVYHNFVIQLIERDHLKDYLLQNGIDTKIHYPVPLHLQECSKNLGYKEGDLINAERLSKEMLSLPIYPELEEWQIDYVIQKITSFFNS